MDYVKALLIKFVMTTIIMWLVLGVFYGAPIGQIVLFSAVLTGVSFIVGDLIILPKFENWGAVIADFLMVFAAVWFYSSTFMIGNFSAINIAAISALVISVGEVFFHRYVDKHILHVDNRTGGRGPKDVQSNLQTEFGKDIDEPEKPEDR